MKKLLKTLLFLVMLLWGGGYVLFVINVLDKHPLRVTEKTDAIIVLTGGNHRIDTGLTLFASDLSPHLFITGVYKSVDKDELITRWKGEPETLPDCCITLGHHATTTHENAIETKGWLEGKDIKIVRLVTSTYHMDRALLELGHLVEGIVMIPHPVEDYHVKEVKFWQLTFEEYNKILFRIIMFTLEKYRS